MKDEIMLVKNKMIIVATVIALIGVAAYSIHSINSRYQLSESLIAAVKSSNIVTTRMLLEQGADPNSIEGADDPSGRHMTALMIAADQHRPDLMKLLLAHGANIAAGDGLGWTALIFASGSEEKPPVENVGSVQVLLDKGADVNGKGAYGVTPLGRAATCGSEQSVKLLLERGAKVDAQSKGGTALAKALKYNRPAIVTLLKQAGAKN